MWKTLMLSSTEEPAPFHLARVPIEIDSLRWTTANKQTNCSQNQRTTKCVHHFEIRFDIYQNTEHQSRSSSFVIRFLASYSNACCIRQTWHQRFICIVWWHLTNLRQFAKSNTANTGIITFGARNLATAIFNRHIRWITQRIAIWEKILVLYILINKLLNRKWNQRRKREINDKFSSMKSKRTKLTV